MERIKNRNLRDWHWPLTLSNRRSEAAKMWSKLSSLRASSPYLPPSCLTAPSILVYIYEFKLMLIKADIIIQCLLQLQYSNKYVENCHYTWLTSTKIFRRLQPTEGNLYSIIFLETYLRSPPSIGIRSCLLAVELTESFGK